MPHMKSRIATLAFLLINSLPLVGSGIAVSSDLTESMNRLPVSEPNLATQVVDYLINPEPFRAGVYRSEDGRELILENGLIRRVWRVEPNGACVGFDNLMNGQAMLRSVRPEARVTINESAFDVGGLTGQPNHAYLQPEWLDAMQADPSAMKLVGFSVEQTDERIQWHRRRHHAPDIEWPPAGVTLRMDYEPPAQANEKSFSVSICYELYDGIPVICKWLTVNNLSPDTSLTVTRFRSEELAAVEHTNWVELRGEVSYPEPDYLHVETDFAFGGFNSANANRHTTGWREDPLYTSQVNYLKKTPCLMVVEPTYGPAQDVGPGEQFDSFNTFELVYDSGDRERRGLALRRMYRTIAPWITENPITHHLLNSDPDVVTQAIDNAEDVGFEAIILSFGSGFQMENTDEDYLRRWKEVADYAEQRGVELGAYSLFSSRSVGNGNDVVSPEGQSPAFGRAPAATSQWGLEYFAKLRNFYDYTGFDQFENDGPYPGDVDVTPRPPYQKGEQDSRWAQWEIVAGLYRQLRATGVYINQPDYYFLVGGNKTGMGYREVNWSLPRAQQVIHTRQNIYDGTWTKTPSMGWMHVPLAQYHGGGAAATIEPLHEHIDHYEAMLRSNLGMGVQAHYRGPRLFDTDETRTMVAGVVDWFKTYRDILESDIIHGRRADGRSPDWILHVNPQLEHKGMLCVYNPLDIEVRQRLNVNLYYTGLTDVAQVSHEGTEPEAIELSRDYRIALDVVVPPDGMTWYVIR
ncbi:MAG: alpha-galactosidase [Planctomycetota bacterium]